MNAERLHSTAEDPYAAVRENRDEGKAVPQEMTNRFGRLMKRAVIRTAFPTQSPGHVIHRFMDTAKRDTPFRITIEGKEAIQNADIILANHQGPQTDNAGGVDGKCAAGKGTGGTEGLYAHALLPPHTRYVLKNYLTRLPFRDTAKALLRCDWQSMKKELAQLFMALAFRKTKPIVVDRTLEKPPRENGVPARAPTLVERKKIWEERRAPHHEYVRNMREERRRVAAEICRSRAPVMMYPEGTRSNDGKIQGFVSEFFESIVTDYLLPRLEDGRDIRIGILVADILSAFPDGVGQDVKAYDEPITMRGITYDPTLIVNELRARMNRPGATGLDTKEIKMYGRMMLMDVRRQMAEELVLILKEREVDGDRAGPSL